MSQLKILPKVNEYDCYEIRMESIGGLGANVAGKILAQAGILGQGLNGLNFSSYGSEKQGTPVKGFIRFTEKESLRINSPVTQPHLIALFHISLANVLPVLEGLKPEGTVVVNTNKTPDEIRDILKIPGGITVYCVDAIKITVEEKVRMNAPMMGAITKATGFLDPEQVKKYIRETFKKKYPQFVEPNCKAFDRGYKELQMKVLAKDDKYDFIEYRPFVSPLGYDTAPMGGVITDFGNAFVKDLSGSRSGYIPVWHEEKCIHCGQCDIVCPDYVPVFREGTDHKGKQGMVMRGIDYKHCKGCLKCVEICPTDALTGEIEAEVAEEILSTVPK